MAAKDSDAKHEQLTAQTHAPRMRDLETIDAELQLAVAFRCAARERGGPLPSKPWRTRCWMNTARLTDRAATRHGNLGELQLVVVRRQGFEPRTR